jgi:hypothetical protein
VEDGVVVKTFARQEHEIVYGARGFGSVQLAYNIALIRFEGGNVRF